MYPFLKDTHQVKVIDIQGRVITTLTLNGYQDEVNLELSKEMQVLFLEITAGQGSSIRKVIH